MPPLVAFNKPEDFNRMTKAVRYIERMMRSSGSGSFRQVSTTSPVIVRITADVESSGLYPGKFVYIMPQDRAVVDQTDQYNAIHTQCLIFFANSFIPQASWIGDAQFTLQGTVLGYDETSGKMVVGVWVYDHVQETMPLECCNLDWPDELCVTILVGTGAWTGVESPTSPPPPPPATVLPVQMTATKNEDLDFPGWEIAYTSPSKSLKIDGVLRCCPGRTGLFFFGKILGTNGTELYSCGCRLKTPTDEPCPEDVTKTQMVTFFDEDEILEFLTITTECGMLSLRISETCDPPAPCEYTPTGPMLCVSFAGFSDLLSRVEGVESVDGTERLRAPLLIGSFRAGTFSETGESFSGYAYYDYGGEAWYTLHGTSCTLNAVTQFPLQIFVDRACLGGSRELLVVRILVRTPTPATATCPTCYDTIDLVAVIEDFSGFPITLSGSDLSLTTGTVGSGGHFNSATIADVGTITIFAHPADPPTNFCDDFNELPATICIIEEGSGTSHELHSAGPPYCAWTNPGVTEAFASVTTLYEGQGVPSWVVYVGINRQYIITEWDGTGTAVFKALYPPEYQPATATVTSGPCLSPPPGPPPPPSPQVCVEAYCASGAPGRWIFNLINGTGDFATANGAYTIDWDGSPDSTGVWTGTLTVDPGTIWTVNLTSTGPGSFGAVLYLNGDPGTTSVEWSVSGLADCCGPLAMIETGGTGTGTPPDAPVMTGVGECGTCVPPPPPPGGAWYCVKETGPYSAGCPSAPTGDVSYICIESPVDPDGMCVAIGVGSYAYYETVDGPFLTQVECDLSCVSPPPPPPPPGPPPPPPPPCERSTVYCVTGIESSGSLTYTNDNPMGYSTWDCITVGFEAGFLIYNIMTELWELAVWYTGGGIATYTSTTPWEGCTGSRIFSKVSGAIIAPTNVLVTVGPCVTANPWYCYGHSPNLEPPDVPDDYGCFSFSGTPPSAFIDGLGGSWHLLSGTPHATDYACSLSCG